jgi:hypothetical protein
MGARGSDGRGWSLYMYSSPRCSWGQNNHHVIVDSIPSPGQTDEIVHMAIIR